MKNQLFSLLRGAFCISLPTDTERRKNASLELSSFGVEKWDWHDGVVAGSAEVVNEILSGGVRFSPPCFRCGKVECTCENNFLTFPQVAVCLAYRHLWERICRESTNEGDLYLLCEDDVAFTGRALEGAAFLAQSIIVGELDRNRPLLVRLGWARGKEHNSSAAFGLEADRVKMSNPCYLLNSAMARRLLEGHTEISHTVDVFTHREESKKGGHFTLFPPIAYEHSWSTGRFESAIFPRKTRRDYLWQNATLFEKLKSVLGKRDLEAVKPVRKRFEFCPGILVVDAGGVWDPGETRSRLPSKIEIAVWSRENGWLNRWGDLTAVVPDWGRWYGRIGAPCTLSPEFGEYQPEIIFFENEKQLNEGWARIDADLLGGVNSKGNALALLRLERDRAARSTVQSLAE